MGQVLMGVSAAGEAILVGGHVQGSGGRKNLKSNLLS